MRDVNTTPDPDKAHLLFAQIVERDRLALIARDWLSRVGAADRAPIQAELVRILEGRSYA